MHGRSEGIGPRPRGANSVRFTVMTPDDELVGWFATRGREVEALRALTGGITATHMRRTPITEDALAALVRGLNHPSPRVRWWCVQVLDHATDPRAVTAISALLEDEVPRVRRVAAHALGCVSCKPEWDGALPAGIATKLASIAAADPNQKVRNEATFALSRRGST
jgi:HEAT repeats